VLYIIVIVVVIIITIIIIIIRTLQNLIMLGSHHQSDLTKLNVQN
jgi:hypothetical protein